MALAAALAAPSARAQPSDDWSLTRARPAPAERRAVPRPTARSSTAARDRQRRSALADPSDELAFEQLRSGELERTGALDELSSWLRGEAARGASAEAARLLLARVHASEGHGDEALAELTAVLGTPVSVERARRVRVVVLRELGRWSEAAAQLELLAGSAQSPGERASLWRAAARERLRTNDAEAALGALAHAREQQTTGTGLVARQEQRALELEAYRAAGKLAELAQRLTSEGAWEPAARVWEELGAADQALAAYRKALAAAPSERALRTRLTQLLAECGQLDAAVREARELVRRSPGELEPVLLLAELLRAGGRRAEALVQLATFARRSARDVAVHHALRELYERWNEPLLAEQELQRAGALAPRAPEQRVARADQALARGDRAQAVALLRGEQAGPRTAAAEAALADLLGERDLLPEALEHSERALALAPRTLPYLRARASLLERSGRALEAEQAWAGLLEHAGADRALRREARQHLVGSWSRAGTVAQHTAELRARQASGALDGAATLLLVELYARDAQQLPAQLVLLERRLEEAPRDLDALLALTRVERQQGHLPAALSAWQRVLELGEPEVAGFVREALQAALESAHEREAGELVERARSLAADDPAVQRLAGDFYAARAERGRARSAYERALALDPGDAAAALALAGDAFERGDAARARALLQPLLQSSDDEAALNEAVRLLLRRDPAYAERSLLAASRVAGARPLLRRLLFEHWADTLRPLAASVAEGATDEQVPAQLTSAVHAGLFALLEALALGAPHERELALSLLEAVPAPAALEPLLALAEANDRPQQERARALAVLGQLRAPASFPRLLVLYASAPRALRPFVLWALGASGDARVLHALPQALASRTREERALAVVLAAFALRSAGAEARASTGLPASSLVDAVLGLRADPDPAVRTAARWAIADEGHAREDDPGTLSAGGSQAQLVLAARVGRDGLAEGLFVADLRVQELAAAYLREERRPLARAPAPRWPFVVDDYLERVARGVRLTGARRDVPRAEFAGIARALVSGLSGERGAVESTLRALVPYRGGVLPGALLHDGCAPVGLSALLAEAAQDRLASLFAGPDPTLRTLAVAPLVLGGAAAHGEVLALLARDPSDLQLATLRALARLPTLPPRLRPAVELLARRSSSWPTRLWATRALRVEGGPSAGEPASAARGLSAGEPTSEPQRTPTSEPVALVRAAAHTAWGGEAPPPPACAAGPPATN